jgi:hypothetical protein
MRVAFHDPAAVAAFSRLEWILDTVKLACSRCSVWSCSRLVMLAMVA